LIRVTLDNISLVVKISPLLYFAIVSVEENEFFSILRTSTEIDLKYIATEK